MTKKSKPKRWQIYAKQRWGYDSFTLEKFLTGGRHYYSFKEAQYVKKELQKMSVGFIYKVVRVD